MPWCDDCSKFWNPPELDQQSRCPTCGAVLAAQIGARNGRRAARRATRPIAAGDADEAASGPSAVEASSPGSASAAVHSEAAQVVGVTTNPATRAKAKGAPWHFKLLVVGVTVYMIYRIYWLIEWLPKHI